MIIFASHNYSDYLLSWAISQIAKFMGPALGPPGPCRPQEWPYVGPMNIVIRDPAGDWWRCATLNVEWSLVFFLDVRDNYVVHSNTGHYFLHVLRCPWCILTVKYIIFLSLYLLSGMCPYVIMQTCSTMLNTYIERLKRIKWMALHYIQWTVCLMNICSQISWLCFCNIWEPFLTIWLIHILIFNMTYFTASYISTVKSDG